MNLTEVLKNPNIGWAQVNGEAIKTTELCRSRRRGKNDTDLCNTVQNQQPLLQIYNLKT